MKLSVMEEEVLFAPDCDLVDFKLSRFGTFWYGSCSIRESDCLDFVISLDK